MYNPVSYTHLDVYKRQGIMSIDQGQFEAGRSLGLNYTQTMIKIILPQAVKNILPALGNELIVLLKETSISGYIGLMDLTLSLIHISWNCFFPRQGNRYPEMPL